MGSGGLHGLQNRWSASLAMSTDGSFPSRPRHFVRIGTQSTTRADSDFLARTSVRPGSGLPLRHFRAHAVSLAVEDGQSFIKQITDLLTGAASEPGEHGGVEG